VRIFAAFVVWAAAIAAAAGLSSVVAGSVHDTPTSTSSSGSSSSTTQSGFTGNVTPTAPFQASNVKATDSDSLFQAANLNKVLAVARREYGADAKVSDFVIYPGYLSMTLDQGGTEIDFYMDASGSQDTTKSGAPASGDDVFKLSKVQATAPAVIAGRIAGNSHVSESDLHYFIARPDPVSGHFQWLVYPNEGASDEYFEMNGSNAAKSPLFAYTGTGLVRID